MTTGTPGSQARQFDWQSTHYLRKTINWNDAGIGTPDQASNKVGVLPQLASIVGVWVEIVTPFNAGTANVVTVGSNSGSDNNIVASGDVAAGAAGMTQVTRSYGRGLTSAALQTVYATYAQSGTAATQGQAIVIIEYVPNNDK
jgi:hypothetical protein